MILPKVELRGLGTRSACHEHTRMTFTDRLQTWGIENINGERRYTRHVDFTGPKGESVQTRLVFDYREILDLLTIDLC